MTSPLSNASLLSVIIPTLNEAERLPGLLRRLRAWTNVEVLVADGGGDDGTMEIARTMGAQVLSCSRGRARQMNAGAARSTGEILWFVHADSVLPEAAATLIRETMADSTLAGGCFRLRIEGRGLAYRLCDDAGNLVVDWLPLACGDHGIFVRRSVFEAIGGFPDMPLFEDVEMYRAMRRFGRVRQLRPALVTSARRWEAHGPWRVTRTYLRLWALYLSGAGMERIERAYRGVSGVAPTHQEKRRNEAQPEAKKPPSSA